MPTSRTGTAQWKTLRAQAIRKAQRQGITNCPNCAQTLDYTAGNRSPNSVEVDHIVSHAQGGTDTADNVQVICGRCNRAMGDKRRRNTPEPPRTITPKTSRQW